MIKNQFHHIKWLANNIFQLLNNFIINDIYYPDPYMLKDYFQKILMLNLNKTLLITNFF